MEKEKENFDFPERPIGRLFSEIASSRFCEEIPLPAET